MATAKPTTVKAYLDSLPDDRKAALKKVHGALKKAMPKGFEEGLEFGMISWSVPLSRKPDTYNGRPLMYVALASQKSHMAVYLSGVYGDPKVLKAFTAAWAKSGKKLDMGKSCVRFKKLDDLALEAVTDVVARVTVDDFVAQYERARG